MALQIRRGPTIDRAGDGTPDHPGKLFAQGELIFDTDMNEVFIGDSVDGITGTIGGRPVTAFTSDQARDAAASIFDNPDHENIIFTYDPETKKITASVPDDVAGIFNVADDLTPELGGNLSLNSKNINGTGNINITGSVTSTGDIQTTAGSLKGDHIGVVRSGDGSTIVVNNGTDGTNAIFTGSLNGNAATVTNGVVTTGSYSDPSWITSLAGTKVTNAVLTTESYSDPSWITSLDGSKVNGAVLTSNTYADPSWITSLSGTKVTDAVLTTGSYSDPSWITSLAGTKVTNAVLTTESYSDPSWITGLATSKLIGNFLGDGNAVSVTNVVYTIGDQTINGVKTFTSTIEGNLNGNVNANSINTTDLVTSTLNVGSISNNTNDISVQSALISDFEIESTKSLAVPGSFLASEYGTVFFNAPRLPSYTSAQITNLTSVIYIDDATWSGGVATLTFSDLGFPPFLAGDFINIESSENTAWNGTNFQLLTCNNTSCTFSLVSDPGTYIGSGYIRGPVINGTIIYNLSVNRFQGRANGSWVDLNP